MAPHNFNGHLGSFISAQLWSRRTQSDMEIDIDDVSWKDDIVTHRPGLRRGELSSKPAGASTKTLSEPTRRGVSFVLQDRTFHRAPGDGNRAAERIVEQRWRARISTDATRSNGCTRWKPLRKTQRATGRRPIESCSACGSCRRRTLLAISSWSGQAARRRSGGGDISRPAAPQRNGRPTRRVIRILDPSRATRRRRIFSARSSPPRGGSVMTRVPAEATHALKVCASRPLPKVGNPIQHQRRGAEHPPDPETAAIDDDMSAGNISCQSEHRYITTLATSSGVA